jgi:hypothetical protein
VEATVRDRAQSASGNQVSVHRIFSRRDVLRSSALLAGGSILAGAALASRPAAAAAASKVPQSEAGYKSVASGAARCDRCVQFQPPAGCKIVAGAISPAGSCDFFAPRQ